MAVSNKCIWCGSTEKERITVRKDGIDINKCSICGLISVGSINYNPDSFYGDSSYFIPQGGGSELGYHENYDLISPFYLYWQRCLVDEIVRCGSYHNLLEVGCATGNLLEMLRLFNPDINTQGLDLSKYSIEVAKSKGLNVSNDDLKDTPEGSKFDIIFTSETMEHMTEPTKFVEAVRDRLEKDGSFVFFVPAVSEDKIRSMGGSYPPLNNSLEHVTYFTKSFLFSELEKIFGIEPLLVELGPEHDPYILGVITENISVTEACLKIFSALKASTQNVTGFKEESLGNVLSIAAKFGNFELANSIYERSTKAKVSVPDLLLMRANLAFNEGRLFDLRDAALELAGHLPVESFLLKTLYLQEKFFRETKETEIAEVEKRLYADETEINNFKMSRIVGTAIKLRDKLRQARKKAADIEWLLRGKMARLLPKKVKRLLSYLIRLTWLAKVDLVTNERISGPLVTVVTPFYNHGKTIGETAKSVFTQSFKNIEYIIVDDGSAEEHASALGRLSDSRLRVITQKNMGKGSPAHARNRGIKEAKGKYIVCLDADDILDPLYLEKLLFVIETDPNISLVSSNMRMFGVENSVYCEESYRPLRLLDNNMIVTGAMFRKSAWEAVGGYKQSIGYEDWEFWINLAENGHWGKLFPEAIYNYRTAVTSRYTEDQQRHKQNIDSIKALHPQYYSNVHRIIREKKFHYSKLKSGTELVNLSNSDVYNLPDNKNKNLLLLMPWMAFGGAETLVYNYAKEIKDKYNISFVTTLKGENPWEYKFREITNNIYHLPNMFDNQEIYIEFIINYIKTHNIDVLHGLHVGYNYNIYQYLPRIRQEFPNLKIVFTFFNDGVPLFGEALNHFPEVDMYVSDNSRVAKKYAEVVPEDKITVIPNGIDSESNFKKSLFDRGAMRGSLDIGTEDLAVFYIGRVSEEKKPDVFVDVAERMANKNIKNIKFFMVGDGPMRAEIESDFSKIDNFSYLGYQTDIAKYLSAADIFVLPSRIEGFPLSILEAMAMNVVVIASDVGAVSEVIDSGKDGFVVPPSSAADIIKNITELKSDHSLLEKIKVNARAEVEKKYSNIILGDNYIKMYEELLK